MTFDEYAAKRPKPWLTETQREGYYASMFFAMRNHDMSGNDWTRDAIGAYMKLRAGGETGHD